MSIFAAIVYGWSLGELAIAIVILAAVCALVFVALRQFGIAVPSWVVQIGWILVVAFVVIVAIRFLLAL